MLTAMGAWSMRSAWVRAVMVVALVVPLALSSAFPAFARWLAGPAAHVCHCEVRGGHSTCACPICHPDDPEYRLSDASIRGKCGDDDVAFGGSTGLAVLPAALSAIAPASLAAVMDRVGAPPPPSVDRPPPIPPPRRTT